MTGYGLVTNVQSLITTFQKYTSSYQSQLTLRDHQLIKAIERRLNSLFQPLNVCMMLKDQQVKPAVTAAIQLVNEIQSFLTFEQYENTIEITDSLEHYCAELDSATT